MSEPFTNKGRTRLLGTIEAAERALEQAKKDYERFFPKGTRAATINFGEMLKDLRRSWDAIADEPFLVPQDGSKEQREAYYDSARD